MNRFLLAFIVITLTIQAAGQPGPVPYEKGYIYLKNGSVLKGKYFYSSDLEKIRVVSGKNIWIFNSSEIDRVSRLKPVLFDSTGYKIQKPAAVTSNWFNLTELGVLASTTDNRNAAPFIFSTSVNRKIYRNLSAGIGIGAELLNETYMPVTANFTYRLRDSHITPFMTLQAGYQIPVEDARTIYNQVVPYYYSTSSLAIYPGYWPNYSSTLKAKGGLLVNPSFGMLIQSWQGLSLGFTFGYRFHRLHYTGENNYGLDVDFSRLSVKLAFLIY